MRTRAASARGAAVTGAASFGAAAIGAAAFGAFAGGAVAIGALAIRRLAIRRGRVGRLSIDDLEVGRLRVRELVVEERGAPRPFEVLEGHNYANLTTYRKSGEAVPTTVWFAEFGGKIYVTTPPDSGKMKRIRNDPRVTLAPSSARGKPRGGGVRGTARPIVGTAPEGAERALREKHRMALALFRLFGRGEVGRITLEIGPGEREGA